MKKRKKKSADESTENIPKAPKFIYLPKLSAHAQRFGIKMNKCLIGRPQSVPRIIENHLPLCYHPIFVRLSKVLFIGRYLYFLFYVILAINLPNYSLLGQPVINPIIDFRSWWKKEKKLGLEGACNLLCPVKLYKGIRLTLTQRVSKKKYTNGFRSGGNILGQSALKC